MMANLRLATVALVALCAFAAAVSAARADVVGAWTLTYTTKDGVKIESVLTVTKEGDKLAGTISSPRGSVALNEISVTGDDIAFAIIRVGFGDTIRIDYTGKVEGDSMKLKMKVGAREPLDVIVKRK
jgi:hypothetical protein